MLSSASAVLNTVAKLTTNSLFHELTLRSRVVLSQLPLTVSMVLVVLLAWAFHPEVYANPLFLAGLAMHALLFLLCYVVPWEKLWYPSFLVIPLLDFVAITLTREGSLSQLTGVGLLAVFPVFWLAASGQFPRLSVWASALCTLLMVWVPSFIRGNVSAEELTSPLLLPLMMLGIAISVSALTASMDEQQRQLTAARNELRASLDQLARRERLLQTILDTVGIGVLAVDADGHDILMNRQQRKHHRLATPPDKPDPNESQLLVYGDGGRELLPAEQRPVCRAIRGEQFQDNLIWLGAPQAQRVMSTSARQMVDDAGNREGLVVTFSDVTDLVEALSAKDDFLSNVSHELRTPLTSILGYVELMLEDHGTDEDVNRLQVIERNAERLQRLVSDLLTSASGSIEVRPRPADLADVVRQSLATAFPHAADAGIELVNGTDGAVPANIDPVRMGQVLDNLLSNAIKYSPDGGTVTVRSWADGRNAVCEVQDTGMGMSEEDRRQVFTRFHRAGSARKAAIPGVGLGLAISKAIVESHGGTISCESSLGRGSTFTITLPAESQRS